MADAAITWNQDAWEKLARDILATDGVTRMHRVADACNAAGGTDQYLLSVEGEVSKRLRRRDQVTVITAGIEAIKDNVYNERLLQNFYLAGGTA